jgi:hypothetical protein
MVSDGGELPISFIYLSINRYFAGCFFYMKDNVTIIERAVLCMQ